MALRGTILQPWNYHTPRPENGLSFWETINKQSDLIKKTGYTAVWLPPCSLGTGGIYDVGYGIKDWYALDGTKYGNKRELKELCNKLHDIGLNVYHDQVFNHLMGGAVDKDVWCLSVKFNNKNEPANDSCVWFKADIYTNFPHLKMNYNHFDAYFPNDHECWAIRGKKFDAEAVCDPLCGCDLDYDNVEVVKKLEEFGLYFKKEIKTDGYRFDAVKHIRPKGTFNFLTTMKKGESKNLFAVGEFLDEDVELLHQYIMQTCGQISLFDFPLQRKIVRASQQGSSFDLGSIFQHTLTNDQPTLSVTFVHSHDDMPPIHDKEGRGSYIRDWFISQAYALILLRDQGYPSVSNVDVIRHNNLIKRYMLLRNNCTYGIRTDKFDHYNTVGWSFSGHNGHNNSMAVVMSNGGHGTKWLPTQKPDTIYRDFTQALDFPIKTNSDGWAEFQCPERNTSVWIEEGKFNELLDKLKGID